MSNSINYSQCWEDPAVLRKALEITNRDTVLSITSAGDNTLALLLSNPKQLDSIDLNPAQNYLLELKIAALKAFEYDDFLAFLGVVKSYNREKYFTRVETYLSPKARNWWKSHITLLKNGIVNTGRFERFLNLFRKYVLPLIHSKSTISKFINTSSMQEQISFYQNHWNTRRWRFYFKLTTNRFVLKNFARQKGMFNHVEITNSAKIYIKRLEHNFHSISLASNYFMHYCLIGHYTSYLPPYLQKSNFSYFKSMSFKNLSIVTNDLLTFLKKTPDNTFSKFNLSDIFEALSDDELNLIWQEIIRTAENNAKVAFWENLLERGIPNMYSNNIKIDERLSRKLASEDKVFFYGNFYICTIKK